MRILGLIAPCLAPIALQAQEVTEADWARVAEPAFAEGTHGQRFVVLGKTMGCFDEEGFQVCGVEAEGLQFLSTYGSVTPEPILDLIGKLPVGTEVELSGDVVLENGTRVEAIFSRLLPPM